MVVAASTICTENGELLCYTNGIFIADKNGDPLQNGDGLSPCPYTTTWQNNGLNIQQAVLFLPCPDNKEYYYLFHFSNDTLSSTRPGTLYYSVIDKETNFGLGSVIRKNVIFAKGKFREGGMTACRHANGRDWWLIIGESNNNTFDKFLVTGDTVTGPYRQSIGPDYLLPSDVAYSCFSQDGSKYVTGAFDGYVSVFDFDRCNGDLNNPLTLFNNITTNPMVPVSGCASVALSPNGRFLYVSSRLTLNQYDLWSANVQDSVRLYTADSNDFAQIDHLMLAPDGRLFASCWNGGFYYFHTIERPNEKGDSCIFLDTGFIGTITQNTSKLPNMPNYKLGALTGSVCDTIEADIRDERIDKRQQPRIQPNPADKYMYIEMPMQGNYVFELINEKGQVVERRETRQVDIINTENLPGGVYFLKVTTTKTTNISSTRVVVQH